MTEESVDDLLMQLDNELCTSIARVTHEANRVLTEHAKDVPVQPPWDQYPAELKASAINGVKFHRDHPNATPEDAHNNWMKGKLEAGWKLGTYSLAEKRHPHLRPFADLEPEVKLKDKMFRAIVNAMLTL